MHTQRYLYKRLALLCALCIACCCVSVFASPPLGVEAVANVSPEEVKNVDDTPNILSGTSEHEAVVAAPRSDRKTMSYNQDEKMAVYLFEKNHVKQKLVIGLKSRNKIMFTLKIDGKCQKEISGVATSHGGDYEIDMNEDGVAYPVEEFLYNGKNECFIAIRIAADNSGVARVNVSNCGRKCLFNSENMMRASKVGRKSPTGRLPPHGNRFSQAHPPPYLLPTHPIGLLAHSTLHGYIRQGMVAVDWGGGDFKDGMAGCGER